MYLTTRQLAARWGYHPGSIKNLRTAGRGPAYVVLGGRVVRYSLDAVTAYERLHHTKDSR